MMAAVRSASAQSLLHVARAYGLCARLLSREGGHRPRQVAHLLQAELEALGWHRARDAAGDFIRALPRRARRYASWLATNAVPAYETSYREGAQASGGQMLTMADVAGFYRAFGFQVRGERPDYLGAQLEFLALLALKEANALLEGREEAAALCRQTRAEFAGRHVLPWLPAFEGRARGQGIACLAELARLARSLIESDLGG
jgi:TorA maturation chaperone TorD